MQRYTVTQFDGSTFQVVDQRENREICVCANHDDWEDAAHRARAIAFLLNDQSEIKTFPAWVGALGRAFASA
jgi:hypothetical protein